jgi:hypothetical protein
MDGLSMPILPSVERSIGGRGASSIRWASGEKAMGRAHEVSGFVSCPNAWFPS